MNILYLYAEVMGYTMSTIKALVDMDVDVHVVHWDHKKLTPYQMPDYRNVHQYPRSQQCAKSLIELAEEINPAITIVSGWQDKDYLFVAHKLRKQGKIVISGFDGQWHGSLKQYAAAILGMTGYFSRYFSHAWVSGVYQYEYARKLGFCKKSIIFDLYSADLSLFQNSYQNSRAIKIVTYPHQFLFVGRFEATKGLDTLLTAWQSLGAKRGDWELHLIGNGSMSEVLASTPSIVVKDFMQPDKLVNEIVDAGCFILPSRGEPWGVVVHELAAAGLPLIASDVVGAATTFLIPTMNGYSFRANDSTCLANHMATIINSSDEELLKMAEASYRLSNRITPITSAKNLLSITRHKV